MFSRPFHPARFLRAASGTAALQDYCRSRDIPLPPGTGPLDEELLAAAIAGLPPDAQARVDLELAQVNELSGRAAVGHLLDAAVGGDLPPDDVPGGAGAALWFFVHRPNLFREVFFCHEVTEVHAWRTARAVPGIALEDPAGRARALGEELRTFFRRNAGTGRYCAVEAHRVADAFCFAARVADRIQLVEGFTDRGLPTLHRVRPSLNVLFSYSPADGTVLLKSHLRAADRVRDLYQCFGRAVLGAPVERKADAFDLDRLFLPFHPLPDGEDMDSIRLKALHLRYPERHARRTVKLETLASDDRDAIDQLLRTHVGQAGAELHVCYAEIQVRLRVDGRPRPCLIRLWPDRCSLDGTALGKRLTSCLRRWHIAHE